jgi:hypothetical protein
MTAKSGSCFVAGRSQSREPTAFADVAMKAGQAGTARFGIVLLYGLGNESVDRAIQPLGTMAPSSREQMPYVTVTVLCQPEERPNAATL